MNMKKETVSTEERNAKVRAVLEASNEPMGPSAIAEKIGESWCCYGSYGVSAPITPICRRIGAIGVKGKWHLPKEKA